jgi:DtxR family Mn-dependent transcriptional regulator
VSPPPDVSPVAQDYLKVIWTATEWTAEPVTTKALAARLDVSPSTVSQNVRRLTEQGFVTHAPYGVIGLTDTGRAVALAMVRRHRLIETFLVSQLGYTWDEVHDEAEVLEHAVSDRFVDRIDTILGRPGRDPHGDPIPARDGRVTVPPMVRLADLPAGATGVVGRVSDASPEVLQYLTSVGVRLEVSLTVVRREAAAGVITVAIGDGPPVTVLGAPAAAAVWVLS